MSNTIAHPPQYSFKVLAKPNLNLLFNALLLLFALVVYLPVLSNQFQLDWDDQVIVINNYSAGNLTLKNLWAILTEFYGGQYAPVNQLVYTTLHQLAGYNPFWYHAMSLVFHLANVLLVYNIIKTLLTAATSLTTTAIYRIAFITALLLAIHPYMVEAVAWVSASKILIYAFFYLLAIKFYIQYVKSKAVKHFILTCLMFVLAFGAKEQAVTLPLCLLVIDYVLNRDLKSKQVWIEKIPLFALSLVFGYVTMLGQAASGGGVLSDREQYPFYQNVVFACYAVTEYLVKCLFPIKLQHIYFFPNVVGDPLPARFWIYPVAIIIVLVSFFDFFKQKWVLFSAAFFIIHLLFVINLIPMSRHAIVADRYVYIASIGVFFLVAWYFNQLLGNYKYRNLALSCGLIYVMCIGVYAHQYSKKWHDSKVLKKEFDELFQNYYKLRAKQGRSAQPLKPGH